MVTYFKTTAKAALYATAFLVPLIFLPWTSDVLEINKQTVLIFLSSLSVIAWLGGMVFEKQFFVKRSWLFVVSLLLLLAVIISASLSSAPIVSWIGQEAKEYESVVTLLAFLGIFFTGSHFLSETSAQRTLFGLMLISSSIVSLIAFLAMFGVSPLNTLLIGTPNAVGLYLTASTILGAGMWLVADGQGEKAIIGKGAFGTCVRIAIVTTAFLTMMFLLAIDFWGLWIAAIAGLLVVFTFALLKAEEFPRTSNFVIPMIFLVISILFLFLPSVFPSKLPNEVAPSAKASWAIGTKSLKETSLLFGSGPGTFVIDYTKYKPIDVNQTKLWDVRFARANSYLLTLLPTIGVLGVVLFSLFLIGIAITSLQTLTTERAHDEWKMTFIAFAGWSVLTVGMCVYTSNITLSFLFWMLSSVLVAQTGRDATYVSFSKSPRAALITTFVFVLISVSLLTLVFVTAARYVAEVAYAHAIEANESGEPIDTVIKHIDTSVRFNKWNDAYYRSLASALLRKIADQLQEDQPDAAEIRQLVSLTISAVARSIEISPKYVANLSLAGDVYREFIFLAEGAETLSIAAYEQAIDLAPVNPKYRVAQARVYLIVAEQLGAYLENEDANIAEQARKGRSEALQRATTRLEETLELKSDYAPAHYYLALAYERQGNLKEASERLQLLSQQNQMDVGIKFQLGLMYLKLEELDSAQKTFEDAIAISPNYSNARWYLATVYEQKDDLESALAQIEIIKGLNPGNELIEQRLERLQDGILAKNIPEPIEDITDESVLIDDQSNEENVSQ